MKLIDQKKLLTKISSEKLELVLKTEIALMKAMVR